jgi:hypothetical protein
MICPRCGRDQEDGPEECRHCGVVFSRFRPRPGRPETAPEPAPSPVALARAWLKERMFEVPPAGNRPVVVLRGLFLALLAVGSISILTTPMRGPALVNSLLHLIDLPFHEAGHLVVSPLGEFLHILGGTLGQLLVPCLVAGAFLRQGDPFGAAVGGWWLGQNFIDCSPYIADARVRQLLLTSGETGQMDWEGHDWFQLLRRTGLLEHDILIAQLAWTLGAALMLAALAWAGYVLWRQWGSGCATLESDGGTHG